ncbi:MAG: type I-MYXAN CRISPR-associated protein Cas6/Cmx6 [Gallionella sp.]|nr:type I-MYXAN CRISPR-associated protein Cas6/Cmx6 [Gallionella sp.]
MTSTITEMIDAVFDISGETLPASYPFALWSALASHAPTLREHDMIGVLPIKIARSAGGMLLPKRAKLVLRVPADIAAKIEHLTGKSLEMGDATLHLGTGKFRPIQPYPTLHAHLVTGHEDETVFLQEVTTRLAELGIIGKLICGMRNCMESPDRTIRGYSLVIHDLKPDASLRLQYTGLGTDRRYGCGIFVPYKAISDLD